MIQLSMYKNKIKPLLLVLRNEKFHIFAFCVKLYKNKIGPITLSANIGWRIPTYNLLID